MAHVKSDAFKEHLVQVPQGVVAGENTEYVVNVTDEVTTVQVIDGPVYFIDPVTNNTITVETNQMLTLPPAGQSGFSEQDLRSDVSAFNSASINQWWTQTTPNALDSLANFLSVYLPIIIAVVIVAVIIAIAAVVVAKRRGTMLQQPGLPSTRILPVRGFELRHKGADAKNSCALTCLLGFTCVLGREM